MSTQILDVPAKHSFSISALLDTTWNSLTGIAFQREWSPLTKLAKAAVLLLMQKITVGQLRVLTSENIYTFPCESSENGIQSEKYGCKAELRVVKDTFWVRLCATGDLGFAEAYMYGDIECDNLISLFQIFLDNRESLENSMASKLSFLFYLPQRITAYRFLNTIGNARSNNSAHYDISNVMFASFLSEDMTYSSAIFPDLDSDLKSGGARHQWSGIRGSKNRRMKVVNGYTDPDGCGAANGRFTQNNTTNERACNDATNENTEVDELYEAQMCKLDHIIKKAKIQEGSRILEIGSGWGSMAIRIAQRIHGTTIDTITQSSQQQDLAQKRIAAQGLSNRITVHLMDYRSMPPEWEDAFDRVISVEMLENVGKEYYNTYWKIIDWALKPRTGAGVVQVITIPEARWDRYNQEIDFVRKWIFPGGIIPTLSLLIDTLSSGSKGRLVIDSVNNIGPHYARTLREWRRRFLDRFDDVIVPALRAEYPLVMGNVNGDQGQNEIEIFKRKWLYYYCYCEIGFTTRTLGDHIITFTREGYQDFGCDTFV